MRYLSKKKKSPNDSFENKQFKQVLNFLLTWTMCKHVGDKRKGGKLVAPVH